jgi:membrane protein implicated in regulation of membrane protease activity
MIWWYWLVLGMILLAAEIITPGGFYLLFLGLSALAVGTIVGLGLMDMVWLQWLLFSVISIASVLIFRGPLLERMKPHEKEMIDTMVGELATPLNDLTPGATGKAELRGTTWSARNSGHSTLQKGQRARVERVEGLTLWITPE